MSKDPFYHPNDYIGRPQLTAKGGGGGKAKTTRYVYGNAKEGWDDIPTEPNTPAFIIGNKRTGGTIHINNIIADTGVRIVGMLRNKDGEVLATVSKEIAPDGTFMDTMRRRNPERYKMVAAVVKELQMREKPIRTLREAERSMQDIGMFPEDLQRAKIASMVKSVEAVQTMYDLLKWSLISNRTRRQLSDRINDVFQNLDEDDKMKALPMVLDAARFEKP